MLNKTTSTLKLYLLVLVLGAVIVGIGAYGISKLKLMNANAETLRADRLLPIQQLTAMRFAYATGILATSEELENKSINLQQAKAQIEQAEKNINDNWQAYLQTRQTPEEAALVKQTLAAKAGADKAIAELKVKIADRNAGLSKDIIDEQMYAVINPVISSLNGLIHLQIEVSAQLNSENNELYRSTAKKFAVLIALALLFAFALSFVILSDTWSLIKKLEAGNEQLRASEEKCRAFIKYAGDSIFVLDQQLNITDVNDSACKLLGYNREEYLQLRLLDTVPPEDRESLLARTELIRQKGYSLHERRFQRKDGTVVDTEVNVRILQGVGFISIARDITERKKAQQAIVDSEAKYKYLFENNPAYIIIWDLERLTVMEVNETVVKKYGYTREEWKDMPVFKYRKEQDHERIRKFAKEMLAGGEPVKHMNWTHLKKNGEEMYMQISSHKMEYNGRPAILSLANDVTEQIKAQEALRRSEVWHRALVENLNDAIAILRDGEVLYRSASVERINGWSVEDVQGKTMVHLIHPDDIERATEFLKKNREVPGTVSNDQFRMLHKKGHYIYIDITVTNLFDHPDVNAFVINYRDITDRVMAAEKLKQSEQRHRALIENITDAILLLDDNFRNIYQSPSVERIVGFTLEDSANKQALDFIHPDDLAKGTEFLQYAAAHPGEPVQSQFRVLHKRGHYIWIEGTVMNLLADPSVKAFIVNYRDVTQRKKFEEQQALITSIVNSSDDAIISKNLDGIVTSWNHGAEKVLGYPALEIVGQHISMLIPDDIKGEETVILEKIKNGQSVDHYETRRIKKNGETIDVSLTVSPIRDSLGKVIGASKILRDITFQKKAEEEIRSLNENLEQRVADRTADLMEANKALEAFSYSVSHDLRAPVRAVIGFTKIIQKEYANTFNDDLNEMFEHINSSSKRMNSIIDDLLTLAKYEKMKMRPAQVSMKELFKNVWDSISFNAPHKAKLELADLPIAQIDASLMEQVVVNLLSNAVKYSSKKENPLVQINYELKDGMYTFCVKDNGAGFDMKHYDRLFGAFQRLHGSSEFEGTGVGLMLAKRIVEKHGGTIWAESTVGEGASFYFSLPLNLN